MGAGICKKCGKNVITLFHGWCKDCGRKREIEFLNTVYVEIGNKIKIVVDGNEHIYDVGKSSFGKIYFNEIFIDKGKIHTK